MTTENHNMRVPGSYNGKAIQPGQILPAPPWYM